MGLSRKEKILCTVQLLANEVAIRVHLGLFCQNKRDIWVNFKKPIQPRQTERVCLTAQGDLSKYSYEYTQQHHTQENQPDYPEKASPLI